MDYIRKKIQEKMLSESIHDFFTKLYNTTTETIWKHLHPHIYGEFLRTGSHDHEEKLEIMEKELADRHGDQHAAACADHSIVCNDPKKGPNHPEAVALRSKHLTRKTKDVVSREPEIPKSNVEKVGSVLSWIGKNVIGSFDGKDKQKKSGLSKSIWDNIG